MRCSSARRDGCGESEVKRVVHGKMTRILIEGITLYGKYGVGVKTRFLLSRGVEKE